MKKKEKKYRISLKTIKVIKKLVKLMITVDSVLYDLFFLAGIPNKQIGLGCRVKANCPHVEPGPVRGCPP